MNFFVFAKIFAKNVEKGRKWNIKCECEVKSGVPKGSSVAEPKLFIFGSGSSSGSDFGHNFGSGSSSSNSHILALKTVLKN